MLDLAPLSIKRPHQNLDTFNKRRIQIRIT